MEDDKQEDMEEEDDMLSINEKINVDRSRLVIFPDSQFKSFWDMISFAFILYQSILVPFKLSFEVVAPDWMVYFDLA